MSLSGSAEASQHAPLILRVASLRFSGANGLAHCIALTAAIRDHDARRSRPGDAAVAAELDWLLFEPLPSLRNPGHVALWLLSQFPIAGRFLERCRARAGSAVESDSGGSSLYGQVMSGGIVHLPDVSVTVRGVPLTAGFTASVAGLTGSLARVIVWRLRFGRRGAAHRILRYSHRGIHVGDILASELLRSQPRLLSDMRTTLATARQMLLTRLIVDAVARYARATKVDFALNSEPTYSPMLIPRVLQSLGATSVLATRSEDFVLVDANLDAQGVPGARIRRQMAVPAVGGRACDGECIHTEFVRGRMRLIAGRDAEFGLEVPDHLLGGERSVAVLFLHDFGDGQFQFGVDEFGDLLPWAEFTIDALLSESDASVLVKTHSIVKPVYRVLNERALELLRMRYRDVRRVAFLDRPMSPLGLATRLDGLDWFGVTKHGTVAEELPLLGRTCIASRLGPWGGGHRFAWQYVDKAQLRELVRAGSSLGLRPKWRQDLCLYLQRRYGREREATMKGRGAHVLARVVDRERGLASTELHSLEEWQRSQEYLKDAPASDPILLRAIREVASTRVIRDDVG